MAERWFSEEELEQMSRPTMDRAIEAWAREQGFGLLSLDVWSTNGRALEFYRRLGYSAESQCLFRQLG
jgi:GNAT superfamily N-acetyltransferase